MELLNLFKTKILENNPLASKSTIKNYLSDVRHFISWYENTTSTSFHASLITSDILKLYQLTLGGQVVEGSVVPGTQLSVASTKRHLSSLRKFFSILEKEGIITSDPFRQIIPEITQEPTDYWHIKSFKDHLLSRNASKITVKNYISDVLGFAKWYEEAILPTIEKPLAVNGGFYLITQSILEDYRRRLIDIQNAAPRTINRKLSSLRKYLEFATKKGFIAEEELTLDPVAIQTIQAPQIANKTIQLADLRETEEPKKSYSVIPPVRLLQKLIFFPYLSLEEVAAKKIAELITGTAASGVLNLPLKLSSELAQKHQLRLTNQALHNFTGIRNVAKEFYAPEKMSLLGKPLHHKIIHHTRFTRPTWYKKYHNYAFVHYAHFALLVIFASGVGVALYQNLVANEQKQASAAPTAPPRILSFQGRLTDNLDNPITTTTDLRFAIYSDSTASGAALLWQEVNGAVPDQDGIFSIYLGEGTSIPSTVFTDHSSIYLGVSVGMTPELTPRQRIATVGYATNTEFLQGLPPTTQAGITSFANVVLALDSSGNLTLDDEDPTNHLFQVTNGTFALSGQTLQLTTNTGSNGSIILNPDGEGRVEIHKPLVNNSLTGNLISGGIEVNDKFGILATESAVAAFTINNNTTGGDIIAASSSGTTRFRLTNEGSIFLNGGQSSDFDALSETTLSIGAVNATTITLGRTGEGITLPGFDCSAALNGGKITTTAGGILTCDDDLSGSGGGSNWTLSTANGTLSPINNTLDILVGGTTTESAKFALLGINNARGAQVASFSGTLTMDAIGNLQTTRNQTLTLGGSSTGDIYINSGTSNINLQDYTTIDSNSNSQALRLYGAAESTEIADIYVAANGNLVFDTKNGAATNQYLDFRSEDDEFGLVIRESDGTSTSTYANIYVSDLGSGTTMLNLIPEGNSSSGSFQIMKYQGLHYRAGIGTNPTIGPQGMFHIYNSTADSVPGFRLDNTVDRIAADINADNTTTNVVDITANSLTTGTALNVSGAGGTYGSNLKDLMRLVNNDTSANNNAANMSFFANRSGDVSTPVASISGIITNNDPVSYTGALSFSTAGTGAIPTERLRIDGGGNLTASAYTSCTLKTDSTGLFTCGTDNIGSGSNWSLTTANGTLSPINNTLDILVGGTTTASAKFAVLNVAGGTPTASVSAGTTGGLYLTADGTLATTAKQTLNIGGSTTGIININSGSNQGINVLTGNTTTESSGALAMATGTTTSGTSGIVSLKSGNAAGASGQITLIDTQQNDHFGNVTTESVTFDSTPQDDDIILLLEAADDINPQMTPPAGFTELYYVEDVTGGSLKTFAAWYKRADNEASATYTIDYGDDHFRGSTIGVVFRGAVSSGNPFEVVSLGPEDFDTTPEAPSIDTLTNNAWHITHFFAHDTDFSAVNPPATYTTLERTPQMQMAAYKEIAVAGSTGAQTVTVGASYTTGASLALKPGVTPGASGAVTIASGNSYGNITGGTLNLNTGTTDIGTTGNINLITGAASGVGDSGSVLIDVGSVGLGGTLGTISIGGTNAKAVGIGTTAPTSMLHVAGGNNGGNALAILNQIGSSSNDLLAASASGVTKFVIKNDGTASSSAGFTINGVGSLQSTNAQNLTIGSATTGNIILSPRGSVDGSHILPGADNTVSLGASPSARFKDLYLGPGSLHLICTTGDGCDQTLDYSLGVNTTSGLFEIGINGNAGDSNAALTITEGGIVNIPGTLTVNNPIITNGISGATIASASCVTTTNGVVTGSSDCAISPTNNPLKVSAGAIVPNNETLDLLIGGTTTESAKFAVLNVNGSGPATATVSGNLTVMPRNGVGGLVGIGTVDLAGKLHVYNTNPALDPVRIQNGVAEESSTRPTLRLMDVNPRLTFEDTSTGGGYASNDWSIAINESANGGISKFAIEDITSARTPLTIAAGTNNNTIYTNSTGIGSGTNTPISQLHITRPLANGANGKALAIFDQIENQDILTASASGTTMFTIGNTGNIFIGGLIDADGSGVHDIAGTLNLSGNTLTSSGDLTINPSGGNIIANDVLNIGASGQAAYNYFGVASATNASDSIADVFIQDELEVDGPVYFDSNITLGDAATDGITLTGEILGATPLRFEGSSNDNTYTSFAITDPTGARTITFPDASGTVTLGTGTTNTIPRWSNTSGGLSDSGLSDNGTTFTFAANRNIAMSSGTGTFTQNYNTTASTAFAINTGNLTTGQAFNITGNTSSGNTNASGFTNVSSDIGNGGSLVYLAPDFNLGTAGHIGRGLRLVGTNTNLIAATTYGIDVGYTVTGQITSGTRNAYGINSAPNVTANTGTTAVTNVYGMTSAPIFSVSSSVNTNSLYGFHSTLTAQPGGGTMNAYGFYAANGSFSEAQATTTNKYGVYVEAQTGADNNYGAYINSTSSTGKALEIVGDTATGNTNSTGFASIASDIGNFGSLLYVAPDFTGANINYGIRNVATDSTTNSVVNYGYHGLLTMTGNSSKNGYGIHQSVTTSSSNQSGDTAVGGYFDALNSGSQSLTSKDITGVNGRARNTGVISNSSTFSLNGIQAFAESTAANTGGTTSIFGVRSTVNSSNATTGSTNNLYGIYTGGSGALTTGGTINQYGVYIANPTSSTTGSATKYGLYIAAQTGADDNNMYGAYINSTEALGKALEIVGSTSTANTQATGFTSIASDVGTSGSLLYLAPDYNLTTGTAYGLNLVGTNSNASASTIHGIYTAPASSGNITSGTKTVYGITSSPNVTGSPSNTGNSNIYGVYTNAAFSPSGATANTNSLYGFYSTLTGQPRGGTFNQYGFYAANGTTTEVAASTTTKFGVYLEPQSGADNNYGLCFDCDGTWTSSTVASGIQFGTDANAVNLYRNGSDILQTQDDFQISAADPNLNFHETDNQTWRIRVSGDQMLFQRSGSDMFVINNVGNAVIGAFDTSGTERLCWDGSGQSEIQDCTGTPGDYAEYYGSTDASMSAGMIVALDSLREASTLTDEEGRQGSKAWIVKANKAYQSNAFGIVSTDPNEVIGDNFTDEENPYPIALNGRVPVKVSTINGPIKSGDLITTSSIPGVGMKSTKAGRVVGMALNSYENTDPDTVGEVLVFVNPTFSMGPLNQDGNMMANNFATDHLFAINGNSIQMASEAATLTLGGESTNVTINGALQSATATIGSLTTQTASIAGTLTSNTINSITGIFANIQTGFLIATSATFDTITSSVSSLGNATAETFTVTADTMIIGGKTLQAYIIETIQNADLPFYNPEIISPVILVQEVKTNLVSPLDESDITFKAQNSKFIIQNSDSEVAWFDNQGNATFSGELTADRLAVNNASISGNLATNTLTTNDASIGGTLRANTIIANNIDGLDNKIASIASGLIASGNTTQTYSTPSGQVNGTLAINTIQANFGIFEQGITSMGPVTSNIVTATDTLSVGSTFTISNNAINTIGADLEFQSLRQGAIAFQGGLIRMDTDGNMSINGNLNLMGTIAAVNGIFSDTVRTKALATSMLSPLPGDDLVIKLSDGIATPSGKLAVQDTSGKEVLSINSRGDIISSGAAQFAKLNFNLVGEAQASSLTEAVASGSAGFATLRAGQPEITIKNPNVTKDSLIYITPFGDTDGKVLYLLRQVPQTDEADGSFTVGASGGTTIADLQFNWLIVN